MRSNQQNPPQNKITDHYLRHLQPSGEIFAFGSTANWVI